MAQNYRPGLTKEEVSELYNIPLKDIIKLASNENPHGPSSQIKQVLAESRDLHLYPPGRGENLVKALRESFPEIASGKIVIGNGMDNVLECLGRALLNPGDKVIIPVPTFSYYEMVSEWRRCNIRFLRFEPSRGISSEAIIHSLQAGAKMIFLCSPNNPTGQVLSNDEVLEIVRVAKKHETFVFLDEAYIEFAQIDSLISEVQKHTNLIIGRTFSKLYGLAGLRIGWGVIPENIFRNYQKVQTPFAANSLALATAQTALKDQKHTEFCIKENYRGRRLLNQGLEEMGYEVLPSEANFVAFDSRDSRMAEYLMKEGIIVRDVRHFRGSKIGLIRCTVGTFAENERLLQTMKRINNVLTN